MAFRTARQAFLQSGAKEAFAKSAETGAFDTALEYAMLAFLEEKPLIVNDTVAMAGQYCELTGAKRVLEILRTLHLPPPEQKKIIHPTLSPPS